MYLNILVLSFEANDINVVIYNNMLYDFNSNICISHFRSFYYIRCKIFQLLNTRAIKKLDNFKHTRCSNKILRDIIFS